MSYASCKYKTNQSIQIKTDLLLDTIINIEIKDPIYNDFNLYNGPYKHLFEKGHHIWKHVSYHKYLVKSNIYIKDKIMWLYLTNNELSKFLQNPRIPYCDDDYIYSITEDCSPSNIPPMIPWRNPTMKLGKYQITNIFFNIIRITEKDCRDYLSQQDIAIQLQKNIIQLDKINNILECSICMDSFNNTNKSPQTLHCGHSYCANCLINITNSLDHTFDNNPSYMIECPECRTITSFYGQLKPSYKILNIIDLYTGLSNS
tara:strand:- start:6890 stop:7666 length:777 start_codon:yes stop_codon:yes gene_type:complete